MYQSHRPAFMPDEEPPEKTFPWGWVLGALGVGVVGFVAYRAMRAVAGAAGGSVGHAVGTGLTGQAPS